MNERPLPTADSKRLLASLIGFIESHVRESEANRLAHIDNTAIFETPIVGVADGNDPLFSEYKRIIGTHHMTPREALASEAPREAEFEDVRVVSWVLPVAKRTKESNAAMSTGPSKRWAHTRNYGESFNDGLRRAIERRLREAGFCAVAPALADGFKVLRDVPEGPTSTWSERHVAYVAGLGAFGLCDGFLTPVGKAMRCGSVVVAADLPVTPRVYDSHYAACPYLVDGSCGECITRCPAGAIGRDGHDKQKCDEYQTVTLRPLRHRYSVSITGCGLCQTGVPCESGLPRASHTHHLMRREHSHQ